MRSGTTEVRRATRAVTAALALALLATACTSQLKDRIARAKAEHEAASGAEGGGAAGGGDPCTLLDSAEVAAAIGPLAGSPYRSGGLPSVSGDACRYDTGGYRRLLVSVDWSGGKIAMKMMAFGRSLTDKALRAETQTGMVLKTGDTLRGDWDQVAMTPASCCSLDALKGDQHVELDWAGTALTPAAAGKLLNTAVGRLAHPLAVNGAAGVAAAQQRWAALAKDSTLDACSLVSQQDAEAILGAPLLGPPDHGEAQGNRGKRICYYRTPLPNAPNLHNEYDIEVREWVDGAVAFASDQFVINGVANGMRRQLGSDTTTDPAAVNASGPWDEIGSSVSGQFEAVKGPVLLIVSGMGDRARLQALLAKAVTALK